MVMKSDEQQEIFETCYRGRQSALHHMAYMRVSKVHMALHALRRIGWNVRGKRVFDYGFGAGTFFRYCPPETEIFGVEIDQENIESVRRMLALRGRENCQLEKIEIATWNSHPALQRTYDLILCSHVLEHLADPPNFLRRMKRCLAPEGIFLGIVPINELADNPHHLQKVGATTINGWASASGLELVYEEQNDYLAYWLQPLYAGDSGPRHKIAQAMSLLLGMPATLLGPSLWWKLADPLGRLLLAKPTQAAFVLKQSPSGLA